MLKVALMGFGGIAQLHRYAYWKYNRLGMPIQLVAVCDKNPDAFLQMTKINLPIPSDIVDEHPFNKYSNFDEMLKTEKPDLIDICLPTRLHKLIATKSLEYGACVLCEKPMAENYSDALQMLEASKKSSGKLMIGQCVRFYSQYMFLNDVIKSKKYGKVLSATFKRVSPLPDWGGENWRQTNKKIGSCLTELGVHDIDVVQHFFGMPKNLCCKLESRVTPYDRADITFNYDDLSVKIFNSWENADTQFAMTYNIEFEKATLVFDSNEVFCINQNSAKEVIKLSSEDGIITEIGYFADIIINNKENVTNPPDESVNTIYLLEKCFESAENSSSVIEVKP